MAQSVDQEEKHFGYDATNFQKFNLAERKTILNTFEDEDAQKMTEDLLDKALGS